MTSFASALPAPATFAPSREDVLSTLAFFFGDPAVPEKLRDYSEHHAMTYHFPDAYYGQNTKIRETLNNLILKAPQEWHTQVALPFVKIEGTTVEWDEMRFDVRLLQRVPYEGVSRMQTSLRRRHRDRVVRRGIGMTIESDFYATEAGRQHFTDQLTSIRYCVQETCNFDAIFSYLTCGNYDFRYDLQKGLRPRRSVRTAMAHEIQMYAIVQKDGLGLDKAVEDCKHRMSRYSVTPNMLIVAPQLLLYLATAPEEKMRYIDGGERAVTRFEEGAAGYEARSFRGLGVFSSMPYEVSDDQDSVQMLQRSTQIGEFYRMHPPPVWNCKKELPPTYMDILIYDEEADKHQHIQFQTALMAAAAAFTQFEGQPYVPETDVTKHGKPGHRGKGGELIAALGLYTSLPGGRRIAGGNGDGKEISRNDILEHILRFPGAGQAAVAAAAATGTAPAIAAVPAESADENRLRLAPSWAKEIVLIPGEDDLEGTVDAIIDNVKAGAWLPLCVVVARPFIEHLMMSAIMTVSGRDTGATLFGPADMQISANTSVKTIEGHYTCHTKSVITKPQNVLVMRDIMCTGYVAGGNCQFFGANKANQPVEGAVDGVFNHINIKQDMEDRLAFSDDASGEYASMLAFVAPYYEEVAAGHRDQVISISARRLPWEVSAHTTAGSKEYFPGAQAGFDMYKGPYGLETLHYGEDQRAAENMEFISSGSVNNALCFVGPHRRYNPFSANFFELVPGQGHFGPDAIPGDARWRRGESVSLAAARNSMVSLEVAAHSQLALRPSQNMKGGTTI